MEFTYVPNIHKLSFQIDSIPQLYELQSDSKTRCIKKISISSLLLLSLAVCALFAYSETINGMKVNVNPIGMPFLMPPTHSVARSNFSLSVYLSILWSLLSEILSHNTSKSDSTEEKRAELKTLTHTWTESKREWNSKRRKIHQKK